MVAEGEVHIFKPWKTPQITRECTIETFSEPNFSSPIRAQKFHWNNRNTSNHACANIPDFEAPCVYVYLPRAISDNSACNDKKLRCHVHLTHSVCLWERHGESCLLTVVIDQKLWALPELFLLMEALVDHPLNSTSSQHQAGDCNENPET